MSDPDAFVFPLGTRFWKEFREPGGRLLETRLLEKSEDGWLYTTYVWTADGSEATQVNTGVNDLHGTGHRVPSRDQCFECHAGRADFVLGWDPVLLGSTGLPGNAMEQAALGYLHVNCGVSCHNNGPDARARDTGLHLKLKGDDRHRREQGAEPTRSAAAGWPLPGDPARRP
jgi:hypothetical protein